MSKGYESENELNKGNALINSTKEHLKQLSNRFVYFIKTVLKMLNDKTCGPF